MRLQVLNTRRIVAEKVYFNLPPPKPPTVFAQVDTQAELCTPEGKEVGICMQAMNLSTTNPPVLVCAPTKVLFTQRFPQYRRSDGVCQRVISYSVQVLTDQKRRDGTLHNTEICVVSTCKSQNISAKRL